LVLFAFLSSCLKSMLFNHIFCSCGWVQWDKVKEIMINCIHQNYFLDGDVFTRKKLI
jgi:hypothetical protein